MTGGAARTSVGAPRPPTLMDWLGAGAAGGATGGLVAALCTVIMATYGVNSLGMVLGAGLAFSLVFVLLGTVVGALAGLVIGPMASGLGCWLYTPPNRWLLGAAGAVIQTGALVVVTAGPALMRGGSTSNLVADLGILLLLGVPGGVLGGLVAARQLRHAASDYDRSDQ